MGYDMDDVVNEEVNAILDDGIVNDDFKDNQVVHDEDWWWLMMIDDALEGIPRWVKLLL